MTSPASPLTPTTPVTVGAPPRLGSHRGRDGCRVEFDDGDVGTYPVGRVPVGHLVDDVDEVGLAGS